MVTLSTLKVLSRVPAFKQVQRVPVRFGGHGHKITIQPSTYTWSEFKDKLHFFVLLGVIPLTLITSYVNIFIGPAELTEIPDGYTPQRHEYFKHPISRFIAKCLPDAAIFHETLVSKLNNDAEYVILKRNEERLKSYMSESADYKAWYYGPYSTKEQNYYNDFIFNSGLKIRGVSDGGDMD